MAEFEKAYRFFERRESPRGMRKVADGVNNPAIFCTRTLLRELPRALLLKSRALETPEFLPLMKTPFLTKKELRKTASYSMPVVRFQHAYLELLRFAHKGKPFKRALLETTMRAGEHNRTGFATGDGIIHVVDYLLQKRKDVSRNEFLGLIDSFIRLQQGLPLKARLRKATKRMLGRLLEIVDDYEFTI